MRREEKEKRDKPEFFHHLGVSAAKGLPQTLEAKETHHIVGQLHIQPSELNVLLDVLQRLRQEHFLALDGLEPGQDGTGDVSEDDHGEQDVEEQKGSLADGVAVEIAVADGGEGDGDVVERGEVEVEGIAELQRQLSGGFVEGPGVGSVFLKANEIHNAGSGVEPQKDRDCNASCSEPNDADVPVDRYLPLFQALADGQQSDGAGDADEADEVGSLSSQGGVGHEDHELYVVPGNGRHCVHHEPGPKIVLDDPTLWRRHKVPTLV